jgi:hypothetical protein
MIDRDAERLRALGYVSHFDRTLPKWENFSLGWVVPLGRGGSWASVGPGWPGTG